MQIGYPKNALTDLLGPPEDVSAKGLPTIYKYGNIQFTFAEEKLSLIAIYLAENKLPWHPVFLLSGSIATAAMSCAEFIQVFSNDFESFAEDATYTHGDQRAIILQPSGVSILFFDGKLDKMFKSLPPVVNVRKLKKV